MKQEDVETILETTPGEPKTVWERKLEIISDIVGNIDGIIIALISLFILTKKHIEEKLPKSFA